MESHYFQAVSVVWIQILNTISLLITRVDHRHEIFSWSIVIRSLDSPVRFSGNRLAIDADFVG